MTRIAVVNDDSDFLDLMGDLLKSRGWQAIVCREGKNAFATIKRDPPDLVILDIRMEKPETGWQVLELLQLEPDTSAIPVVVCSADAVELKAKGEWLGAHGIRVLQKPFDIDDLFAAVEQSLGAAKQSA
jgi:CheY-like chemotaxis protein